MRDVVGFEGLYAVDEDGAVYSFRSHKWLRPGIASNGYPTVALGRGHTRTLHSLVADAYLGPVPEGMEVRHKDGDRLHPHKTNLEFGSRSDNIRDAVRHGTWHGWTGARKARTAATFKKAWETRRQRSGAKGVTDHALARA